MAVAALNVENSGPAHRVAHDGSIPAATLRCVVMDDSRFDRKFLRSIAQDSRFDLDFVETTSISETIDFFENDHADLALLDYRVPDGDGIDFARRLTSEASFSGMPVIVITGEGSEAAAAQALRNGVADYLNKNDITTEVFDNAIENALLRITNRQGASTASAEQLLEENKALRRVSIRNMRLLKGQSMPLIAYAGAAASKDNDEDGEDVVRSRRLAKIARNIVGLIDDTVIFAATHGADDTEEAVDLHDLVTGLVRDEKGEIHASHAHIRIGELPVLLAHRNQMIMLFEEMLLNGIRAGDLGHVPEISVNCARDPDGNPIIVFEEKSVSLSARKQSLKNRYGDLSTPEVDPRVDPHAWSLCQRLVEKNQGQFRIAQKSENRTRIMMRFPKHMIA